MKGALILIIANALVKIIGAIFKIPLANLIGEGGMAYFSHAYTMYTFMFVIATAGLPVAVSKMVSESVAKGNKAEVNKILKASLLLLSIIGIFGFGLLYLGADKFAALLGNPGAEKGIRAIAPAMLFVSLLSAFRGYFQGHQNMLPTALSEVIEAMGKLVIGYTLAYMFMKRGLEEAAAGAVFGVSTGAALAFVLILFIFIFKKKSLPVKADKNGSMSTRALLKKLIWIAVPITIGASVFSLTSVIDMAMIMRRLQSAGFTYERARNLWGSYSGYAIPLFNMPPTLITGISISIVPAVAGAFVLGKKEKAKNSAMSAIRITTLFALPCAVGISILSKPILLLLYNNANATNMLSILGLAVLFVSLVQLTNAVLQATGNVMLPVLHMIIGGILKIIINYYLVGNSLININGAPIGTCVCYIVILILNMLSIRKTLDAEFNFSDLVVKPLFSVALMAVAVLFAYKCTAGFGNLMSVVLSIGAGGVAYVAMIIITGAIKKEDVLLLPKGEKIARYIRS